MSDLDRPAPPDDALLDLIIKQVTEGLSSAEQRELDVLDGPLVSELRRDFERSVAAVVLAGARGAPRLPDALRERLVQQASGSFAPAVPRAVVLPPPSPAAAPPATAAPAAAPGAAAPGAAAAGPAVPASSRPSATAAPGAAPADAVREAAARPARASAGAWWAAAACLLLAVFGWVRSPTVKYVQAPAVALAPVAPPRAAPPAAPPAENPTPLTPAEERTDLLAKAGVIHWSLAATKDAAAAGVAGDVVWDPESQRGFFRFTGLQPNDRATHQYQIWIFDAKRDQRYPVDGGVFDVPADQPEVVIPIHAVLPVLAAKAFAVTVEKPGGVVVSDRKHVLALAAAG